MDEYQEAVEQVEQAEKPGDLFDLLSVGDDHGPVKEYRRLAKILHPDLHMDDSKRAEQAFAKLSQLWYRYGTQTVSEHFTISTKRHTYVVEREPAWRGDLATLYRCEHNEDGNAIAGIMKIPRSPKNSDLMRNEAFALKHIALEGEKRYEAYVPKHLESFKHRDRADNKERLVNVLDVPDGLYSLQEVYEAFPDGIGPRDAAWMWRRMLVALGYIHDAGRIHGALTPEHILIHPEAHGIVLVDWCYAVEVGSPLQAIVPKRREMYPADVLDKQPVTVNLDIRMATQCMLYVLRSRAPRQYKAFAKGSYYDRKVGAFELKEEFDELLETMYGERRFVPFEMPLNKTRR